MHTIRANDSLFLLFHTMNNSKGRNKMKRAKFTVKRAHLKHKYI